jgi:hypothetical protein
MSTTATKAKTITTYDLEDIADYVQGETRTDYTGRGMYPNTCIGITTSDPYKVGYAIAATFGIDTLSTDDDVDRIATGERLAGAITVDSMGNDTIVYFPGWALED